MAIPTLDADLQALWDASAVIEHRTKLLDIQARRDQTSGQAAALTKGVGALMDTAGTVKEELITNIFLTLAPNYMKPGGTVTNPETMATDAARDAAYLKAAAGEVFDYIMAARQSW